MAKLSSASIRLVQKLNRMNKNNEFPIYLVVCFHGRVEKSLGVSCSVKDWDSKREVVKRSNSNSVVLNKILYEIKDRCIKLRNDYELNGKVYTASMLLDGCMCDVRDDVSDSSYVVLYKRLVDERRLRDGSIRRYLYSYRKLCEYIGKDGFIIEELSCGMLKDFALWMEKDGIKTNTIKSILACIASVWNFGIQKRLVSGDDYPFTDFKYTQKYRECPRDYYLEKSHIVRLRDYWLDLVIERTSSGGWRYRDGALDRLHRRYSMEFGILWFLMCYKMNGSSPIDLAILRPSDCKVITINGEEYYSIDIKRKKTSRDVHIRMKRDLFVIIGLEHFLGFCDGHYVYPIINYHDGITDKQILCQSQKNSQKAIKWVRKAYMEINGDIARDNVMNGAKEPTVDLNRLVFYCERHSFAQQYLSNPSASVSGLASLMARSPNTIATYIHQLTRDEEIASEVESMAI